MFGPETGAGCVDIDFKGIFRVISGVLLCFLRCFRGILGCVVVIYGFEGLFVRGNAGFVLHHVVCCTLFMLSLSEGG